jgi:hypothetical protein
VGKGSRDQGIKAGVGKGISKLASKLFGRGARATAVGAEEGCLDAAVRAPVRTFEDITVRSTLGIDGGTSMIVRTVNAETGETLKVVDRVVDASGKVILEHVKFVKP